jgi:hypothetical protein
MHRKRSYLRCRETPTIECRPDRLT